MTEPRLRPNGSPRSQRRRRRQQPEQRERIMFHEALAIFWSVYVLYRFLEMTVDEPINRLEYYTQ